MPGSGVQCLAIRALRFIEEYSNSHEPGQWVQASTLDTAARQSSIRLLPCASYRFRVHAVNVHGTGDPSLPTIPACRTESQRPFRNPANVTTVGDKTHYLVIEWE
ncbi:hypothetical protein BaRGS_00026841, partial [Batillaria attramentaria]